MWRNRDFVKLWTGQTISELGSRITREGLPLTAVLLLGATPAQMGLLSAAGAAPVLLFGLIAGVWVDRMRRRPVMIAADLGRAALLLTIPAAALLGRLTLAQVFITSALVGILTVFFEVADLSFLPSLVERENILEGNSKLGLSSSLAEVLGPGITGLLIQAMTAPLAIFFDAISFLVSALSVWLIQKPEQPSLPSAPLPLRRELAEGLASLLQNPLLRALTASSATLTFFGNMLGTLYLLYAIRELGLGPAALGLTIAMGGVGSLFASLLTERLVLALGLGPTFILSLLTTALASFLIPLAGGSLLTSILFLMLAQLIGDLARTVYFINAVSLRQIVTPERILGRVNAGAELIVGGVGPLGAVIGGFLGQSLGLRPTLALAASGMLLACLWLLLSPVRRLRRRPAPASQYLAPR